MNASIRRQLQTLLESIDTGPLSTLKDALEKASDPTKANRATLAPASSSRFAHPDNAARLTACWNKLEPFADLDAVTVVPTAEYSGDKQLFLEVISQRDELLAALKEADRTLRMMAKNYPASSGLKFAYEKSSAAIAKAKP